MQVLNIMETAFTENLISTFNFSGPWNLSESGTDDEDDNFFKKTTDPLTSSDPFEEVANYKISTTQQSDDVRISFDLVKKDINVIGENEYIILDEPWFDSAIAETPAATIYFIQKETNNDSGRNFFSIIGYLYDNEIGVQKYINAEIDKDAVKYKDKYVITIGTLNGETKLVTKKIGYVVNGFQKERVKYNVIKIDHTNMDSGTKYVVRKDWQYLTYAEDLESACKKMGSFAKDMSKLEIPGSSRIFFREEGSEIQVYIQYMGLLVNGGIHKLCTFDIVCVEEIKPPEEITL